MSRAMKYSGIPWIGKVPKDWNTPLLKGVFREREEKSTTGEETLLSLSQYTGIKPKSETEIADSHIAANYEGYKVVHKGDLVMNIMLAWNGSYAVSDYDGMISPAYCVYYFRNDSNKRYYHYLLRINGYQAAFKTLSRGIIDSRLRLYPEQFYTFPTLQPPLSEQQRIAEFLDRKCGEIGEAIALQEEFIEELKAYKQSVITKAVTRGLNPNVKFKDSGIDWIGEIPQGWKVVLLQSLAVNVRNGYVGPTRNLFKEDGVKYIQSLHLKDGIIDFGRRSYFVSDEWAKVHPKIHTGDLLIVQTGDIGQVAVVTDEYDDCNCHALIILTPNAKICIAQYICYYLRSVVGKELLLQCKTGALLPHLNSGKIGVTPITLPPYEEQLQIIRHLDQKCIEIDSLIAIKQQKIEELKDYKKSIIYEYVTGKKEI